MAEFDFTLVATPVLGGVDRTLGANRIVERADLALVSVAVPHGGEDALAAAVRAGCGLAMPSPTQSSATGEMRAIRTAPDQVLLVFPHAMPDAERVVQNKLSGAGYTTDQTDAWVVLDISGPDTRKALERLCMLDLDEFSDGTAARTVMEHLGAILVRLDAERFFLMSARSSAGSFLHAIETSYRNVIG